MMNKVIILENSGKCRFGGGQKMSLKIASILKEKYNVIFADFTKESIYLDKVKENFPNNPVIYMTGISPNIKCKLLKWAVETIGALLYAFRNLKRITTVSGMKNVMSYATDKKTLIYAYLLKVFYGIPFILHAHLVENPKGLYYPIYMMMAKKASKIICCSRSVVESVKSDKTQLLYNPNFNRQGQKKYQLNKSPFVVAVAGSLISIKGFEYFVRAAQYLDKSIELRVYGSGPLDVDLKRISSNRVKFMGFCDNILRELYESVDVVVVPTIIQEANPLSVLEAKSVGIPVIVTNIGGQAELVHDGGDGICVPIKDEVAIANAITHLFQDKNDYLRMANASYNSAAKYDFEIYKSSILNIFEKVFI